MLINWIRATWYYAGESMKSGTLEEQITDRHDNFISCFAPTNAKLCNVNRRDKPTKKNNYTKKVSTQWTFDLIYYKYTLVIGNQF